MKKLRTGKGGRPRGIRPSQEADEYGELYALEYRLEHLALTCSSLEIWMTDDFKYAVWGRLRYAPGVGRVQLAADQSSLRAAVAQGLLVAEELQRPYLLTAVRRWIDWETELIQHYPMGENDDG